MNLLEALEIFKRNRKSKKLAMLTDYDAAKEKGLTDIDRWALGIDHHPMSVRLMGFLAKHDLNDFGDYFCWKTGGDGDNGETLMYQMDAFFENLDAGEAK